MMRCIHSFLLDDVALAFVLFLLLLLRACDSQQIENVKDERYGIALNGSDVGVLLSPHGPQQDDGAVLHYDLDVGAIAPKVGREIPLQGGAGGRADLHIRSTKGQDLNIVNDSAHAWYPFYPIFGIAAVGIANGPAAQNDIVAHHGK